MSILERAVTRVKGAIRVTDVAISTNSPYEAPDIRRPDRSLWQASPPLPLSMPRGSLEHGNRDSDFYSLRLNEPFTPVQEYRSQALLELIATPAAICGTNSALLCLNLRMNLTLAVSDGFFLQNGILTCTKAAETALLRKTVRDFAGGPKAKGDKIRKSQILRISRTTNFQPLIVVVSPLKAEAEDHNLPEVLIRIVATADRPEIDTSSLCDIFDLTRSEAALTLALCQQGSLKEAAALCGITQGSARQYMKRIFVKTNTSSQVDLLSLLLHYPIL